MATLNVNVSSDMAQSINALSQKLELTVSELLQRAFTSYIEQVQDEEDADECEAIWRDAVANGEKPIPSDEFWREFGLGPAV